MSTTSLSELCALTCVTVLLKIGSLFPRPPWPRLAPFCHFLGARCCPRKE